MVRFINDDAHNVPGGTPGESSDDGGDDLLGPLTASGAPVTDQVQESDGD